jgi:hypothetical protein
MRKILFLQDRHLMLIYHMEFRIHVIDYHHYLSTDKDHQVT